MGLAGTERCSQRSELVDFGDHSLAPARSCDLVAAPALSPLRLPEIAVLRLAPRRGGGTPRSRTGWRCLLVHLHSISGVVVCIETALGTRATPQGQGLSRRSHRLQVSWLRMEFYSNVFFSFMRDLHGKRDRTMRTKF